MTERAPHPWLEVARDEAPLIVSIPHAGTEIPEAFLSRFASPWLARVDADWWMPELYDFAGSLGATVIRTRISRSVIDVNRDPSGVSLYPGQATTELCPVSTFDGEPLYRGGEEPAAADIAERRVAYFDPYHEALSSEIARLRARHPVVVLYDAHSIRSVVPRLFEGTLPNFNIGTNDHRAADPALGHRVEEACDGVAGFTRITNGRFKGGYITRSKGRPDAGVHAVQMELAIRSYAPEPSGRPAEANWPPPYDERTAEPVRAVLKRVLGTCLEFATTHTKRRGDP
ncbi:MAG: N-formylglutamate deformylase [Alphaproteobacteria bacterium]